MRLKNVELEATALLSEVVFGHGFAHYGYFPEGPPEVLSAQALGAAQQAYFERLVQEIPAGTETILDVGSGTGANARALIERGFAVSCVSPSRQMNEMARAKLPPGTRVTDALFEEFEHEGTFDICLFAESFHYIDLERALSQAARYATRGVVIFDYFRREGYAHGDGTRGTHRAFLDAVAAQGVFAVTRDEDMTDRITPTFLIHDNIKNAHVKPFIARFRAELKREYPLRAWLLDRFLGRSIDKLGRAANRGESFAREHEYRLIALERDQVA